MAGIMGDDPQTGPNDSLAQTVNADEAVIEQRRLLDLRYSMTVPEGDKKYGGVCKVAKEVKERPKKRRLEAVAGNGSTEFLDTYIIAVNRL